MSFRIQMGESSWNMSIKEGFIPVDGGKVWYRISGSSTETPLLFVHGGPGFPPYNFTCLETLGNNRPIIFYHQLGCGKSERPIDPRLWTVERFVKELGMVREALGLTKIHLMGHSWGAALATTYALAFPQGIESLILASPLLSTPLWIKDANKLKKSLPENIQTTIDRCEKQGNTNSEEYKSAVREFNKKFWCRLSRYPESIERTFQEANLDVYTTMWGPSEFSCTGNLKEFDITKRLPELRMPVLFTCGSYDEAMPETVAEFHNLLPESKMLIFESSAHHAELEEKEAFVTAIASFLH